MKNIFRYASLLAAAVMLLACGGEGGNEGTADRGLYMVTDKDVIQSDNTDAARIRVFLEDEDVTADAVIYDADDNVLNLDGGLFTASKDGEYKFWATYGTYSTYDENKKEDDYGYMTITAISKSVPEVAEDPSPAKTSFVHRAFLVQYTGVTCGYCPYMIKIIHDMFEDNTIPEKAVLAAVHSFAKADPAYIASPKVNNYPFLQVDLTTGFSHTSGAAMLYSLVNSAIATDAAAGISVNPVLYDDGTLVARVSVKAAQDGNYRVGAWLLEDNIFGTQADEGGLKKLYPEIDFNRHENCVRAIESRHDGSWAGKPLGIIKAGKTAEKTFVMNVKMEPDLDDEGNVIKKEWVREELHLAVIVSKEGKNGFTVCNAVDVPIDAPTPFEYK